MAYWKDIYQGVRSLAKGLSLTVRHLWQARRRMRAGASIGEANYFEQKTGIVTLQYPREQLPVPEIGRYQLHNEIEDCIVCDKCAKICPVNCIDIEPIKSPTEFGKTSDGSGKRLYAAVFDIDMAKCCFCGLCTTVCPTECLTMTDVYDFSVVNILSHNFEFGNMTEAEITEKKQLYEQFQHEKEEAKKQANLQKFIQEATTEPKLASTEENSKTTTPKMAFKPKIKPTQEL